MLKRACALFAPALLLAGCANPAPPRPPTLNLPRISTDLRAERQGARVHLDWTVATYTTDGLLIPGAKSSSPYAKKQVATHTGALAAEICREDIPSAPCKPIARITVRAGDHTTFDDPLPATLQQGAPHLIAYKVRVLNAAGRNAGLSAPADTLSGEAPAPIRNLHIRAVRQGAELSWTKSTTTLPDETILISREDVDASDKKSSGKKNTQLAIPADPGGTLDRTATPGSQFRYTVSRYRIAAMRLHPTKKSDNEIRIYGEPQTALSGVLTDTFPPPTPTSLVAITTPADEGRKAAIDLSWDPVTEDNLAGYIVYRAEQNGPAKRLTTALIPGTSFHDEAVNPGITYTYTVTAIDRPGNESPHSQPAIETLP